MQNEFAQFAFAQFAHFCSFLQDKKYYNRLCINTLQDTPLFCEQIEQKQIEQN